MSVRVDSLSAHQQKTDLELQTLSQKISDSNGKLDAIYMAVKRIEVLQNQQLGFNSQGK